MQNNSGTISATTAAAYALWIFGAAFVVAGCFYDHHFPSVGLWLSGLGGVLWIRRMLCHQSARMQQVFEMGRDYERTRIRVTQPY